MNSKDEIVKVFDDEGGDAHPPAIFTQTGTVGQMDACGAEWPDANFEAEKMARLALQAGRMFGFATVRIPFCITVDADAFGCGINPGSRSSHPSVTGFKFWKDGGASDVPTDLTSPEEFLECPRVRTVLDAASILSKEEDLFLVAGMNGPLACINNLLGIRNVLATLLMEPDKVGAWLKAVTPRLIGYARALSEATDCVMVIEEASTDLTPPECFDSVIGPYLPWVIGGAQKDSFCVTHSCGRTMEVAERLASLGQDGISLEASSDPRAYLDLIGGRTLSLGAIEPVGTLLSKGPSEVVAEARRSADMGFDFVTPECGVHPLTPDENLRALARYREL
ncbi:MAG: hypothetical protein IKQ57_02435 [Candidatus Methanomethylophilaceae archaeon]|nr:hypothetical protein [Candidatus Methanomethylophilaceae archaeon]